MKLKLKQSKLNSKLWDRNFSSISSSSSQNQKSVKIGSGLISSLNFNATMDEVALLENQFLGLPIEVQKNIFLHLSPKSRQELKCVCSRWKWMLDNIPSVVINNQNFERTTKISDAIWVQIRNLTTEFQQAAMFKATIRRLEFWDVVTSYNFVHFLQECCQVQELNFGNVTLDYHRKIKFPEEGLNLPQVKAMTFNTKLNAQLTIHELLLLDFFKQVKFGRLEEVTIHAPYYWYTNRLEFDGLIREAQYGDYHCPLFELELPAGIKPTGLVGFIIENYFTVKKFVARGHRMCPFGNPMDTIDNGQFEKIGQVQFEELVAACRISQAESLVIERQSYLKKLLVSMHDCYWPAVVKAIDASAATLTQVRINIEFRTYPEDPAHQDVDHFCDAKIFENCCQLESLTWGLSSRRIPALNLYSLPKSLQKLKLTATFTEVDLLDISTLYNLQQVDLYQSNYNVDSVVVNDEILQAFIRLENLQLFNIHGCRANQTKISNLAKSQDRFEIIFTVFGGEDEELQTGRLDVIL